MNEKLNKALEYCYQYQGCAGCPLLNNGYCWDGQKYFFDMSDDELNQIIKTFENHREVETMECKDCIIETEQEIISDKVKIHGKICGEIIKLYRMKNADYGDAYAIIRAKYPESVVIRLWDKLLRLENLMKGNKAQVNESIEDTLLDIANYAIMEVTERRAAAQGCPFDEMGVEE